VSLETVAFRMILHPGQAAEYRRRHDAIWPELAADLKARGVVDYRIFLDPGTSHLFAVMTRRRDHGLDGLPQTELMQRWWAMMADVMQTEPDGSPVQVDLPEMFVLTEDAGG
jgi:L-rhamnose mutarotase